MLSIVHRHHEASVPVAREHTHIVVGVVCHCKVRLAVVIEISRREKAPLCKFDPSTAPPA